MTTLKWVEFNIDSFSLKIILKNSYKFLKDKKIKTVERRTANHSIIPFLVRLI